MHRTTALIGPLALLFLFASACDDSGSGGDGRGGGDPTSSGAGASTSASGGVGASAGVGGGGGGGGGSGGGQPVSSCTESACAFPGAEGFGTATPGGRGGQVIVVTTLAPDGDGSFTEALLTPGPRTIVFAVSGVIDFEGALLSLGEEHSYVTIAGQSSPGGITLRNVTIESYHSGFHDAIFRFLRFRGTDNYDNISFAEAHHLVFDHMDFSGATDETLDLTYGNDITIQWSTITNSTSGSGSQNYGALLAYRPTTRLSIHHNLWAHHAGRCGGHMHWVEDGNPDPPDGAQVDYRNNVFHNCGYQALLDATLAPATGLRFNLVGNYAKTGPDTPAESMMFSLSGALHLDDNVYEGQSMILTPYFSGEEHGTPFDFPVVTTTPSAEAYEQVLAWAGAWPRDAMNARTVAEVMAGTGQLGKTDDELITSGPAAPPDSDQDGMPDDWETQHRLDPANAADASALAPSGYSHLEVYLAERAAALIGF